MNDDVTILVAMVQSHGLMTTDLHIYKRIDSVCEVSIMTIV